MSIGMDVSDTTAHVCVMDRTGIQQEFVIQLDKAALLQRLPFVGPQSGVIVMETGNRAAWLKRLLTEAGWRVVVADARKLKAISGQAIKTDKRDARILAKFGMVDEGMPATERLLSDTWVRPVEHQAIFDHVAMRDRLVRTRGDLTRQVRSMVKMRGGKLRTCSTRSFPRLADELPKDLQALTFPLFQVILVLSEQIEAIEGRLETLAKAIPAVQRMLTVPGAGTLSVMAFYAVVGDPSRFATARDVGPYLGLTPRVDQSGKLNPRLGISKCGNSMLRRLLVQCANYIVGPKNKTDSALRRWALAKDEATGGTSGKKIRCAIARKLAVALLAIWKKEDSTWQAFPGSAPEAEIPSAPVGSDDCGAAFVQKHANSKIAASQTDHIQSCTHPRVTTDESAECRRDPAPEAGKKKTRKVAKAAPSKVPRQAVPKPPSMMPSPTPPRGSRAPMSEPVCPLPARRELARPSTRRNVAEEDVLRAERQ
jgi:transposase